MSTAKVIALALCLHAPSVFAAGPRRDVRLAPAARPSAHRVVIPVKTGPKAQKAPGIKRTPPPAPADWLSDPG